MGRAAKAVGFRRALIMCFVLYLPLDVIIRDYIGIALLSSLWDEAFLLLVVAYCIWRRLFRRVPLRTSTTPLDSPILLYLALGIGLMFAVSPDFLAVATPNDASKYGFLRKIQQNLSFVSVMRSEIIIGV